MSAAVGTKQRALVVDDEESIRTLVGYTLERAGFATELIADGTTAFQRLTEDAASVDVVVLDIMLPGMSGMDICRTLRMANVNVPIILLTARDEEVERIVGLELGADDYVTKPFSPRELAARVKAVLRRIQGAPAVTGETALAVDEGDAKYVVGDISLDPVGYDVTVRGKAVTLTPIEFALLKYFMDNRNRVLARDQLLDKVWGYPSLQDSRIVDVHVSHLRDKIELSSKRPQYIRTVRGIGYKFVNGAAGTAPPS